MLTGYMQWLHHVIGEAWASPRIQRMVIHAAAARSSSHHMPICLLCTLPCSKHWKGPFVQLHDKQRLSLSITRTSCFWDSEPLTWICRDLLIIPHVIISACPALSSQRTWLHQAHSTVSGIQIGLNKWYSTGWMNNQASISPLKNS